MVDESGVVTEVLKKDKNTRLITNKDCQYYVDIDNDSIVYANQGEYYLPQIIEKTEE
jgi:hypothetical protein